jgi:hypothetical protein
MLASSSRKPNPVLSRASSEHAYDEGMQHSSQRRLPESHLTGVEQSRLLENGAAARTFTREDRAKGGHARAEKMRRRKELRAQLNVPGLEDLTESELLDRALARLNLPIGSEDDRVALRAVKEVLDRTLGRPRERHDSFKQGPDMQAALARAHEELAERLERRAARVTSG